MFTTAASLHSLHEEFDTRTANGRLMLGLFAPALRTKGLASSPWARVRPTSRGGAAPEPEFLASVLTDCRHGSHQKNREGDANGLRSSE